MKVYTNKNTNLSDWKKIFRDECLLYGIDPAVKSDLAQLHAWEMGYTPASFAETIYRYKNLPKLKTTE